MSKDDYDLDLQREFKRKDKDAEIFKKQITHDPEKALESPSYSEDEYFKLLQIKFELKGFEADHQRDALKMAKIVFKNVFVL
jgi:hypothetical protein